MMRVSSAACLGILLVLASASRAPADDRIARALLETIDVNFEDVHLEMALEKLVGGLGFTVAIDPDVLEDLAAGEKSRLPVWRVTLHLKKVFRKAALRLILEPNGLKAVLEDDLLRILPEAKTIDRKVTRFHALEPAVVRERSMLVRQALVGSQVSGQAGSEPTEGFQVLSNGVVAIADEEMQDSLAAIAQELNQIAATPRGPLPPRPPDPIRDANEALARRLHQSATIQISRQGLSQALTNWAGQAKVQVWIDPQVAERPDQVGLESTDDPLEWQLDQMLEKSGLAWKIEDGLVKIVTDAEAPWKVLDIRDVTAVLDAEQLRQTATAISEEAMVFRYGALLARLRPAQARSARELLDQIVALASLPDPAASKPEEILTQAYSIRIDDFKSPDLAELVRGLLPQGQGKPLPNAAIETEGKWVVVRQTQAAHEAIYRGLSSSRKVHLEGLVHIGPRENRLTRVVDERSLGSRWQPPRSDRERAIEAALLEPCAVHFDQNPLEDCLKHVMTGGIRWELAKARLEDEGIDSITPVNLTLKGMTRKSVLRLLLDPLNLRAVIHRDRLLITTSTHAGTLIQSRPHDIRGIVSADDLGQLVSLIPSVIDPDSWSERGGDLREFRNGIVFEHTREVHDDVDRLLADVRRMAASPPGRNLVPLPADPVRLANVKIEQRLQERGDYEASGVHFEDLLADWSKKHGLLVLLDRKSLEDEGIDTSAPVTLKVKDASLMSHLNLLLDRLELKAVVEHEAVVITTKDIADSHLDARVYDLRHIAGLAQAAAAKDQLHLERPESGDDLEPIRAAIGETIDPESWNERGGPGDIRTLPTGFLFVLQTGDRHRKIERLLRQLAESPPKARQPEADPQEVVTRIWNVDGGTARILSAPAAVRFLKTFVAPETWNERTEAKPVSESLLRVRQTRAVQAEICDFLEALGADPWTN